jgi:hypothetical protein
MGKFAELSVEGALAAAKALEESHTLRYGPIPQGDTSILRYIGADEEPNGAREKEWCQETVDAKKKVLSFASPRDLGLKDSHSRHEWRENYFLEWYERNRDADIERVTRARALIVRRRAIEEFGTENWTQALRILGQRQDDLPADLRKQKRHDFYPVQYLPCPAYGCAEDKLEVGVMWQHQAAHGFVGSLAHVHNLFIAHSAARMARQMHRIKFHSPACPPGLIMNGA